MAFSFCVKNRATGDFSKYCIVPCGKFGSPYPGKAQQPREQRYLFLPVCAVISCVQTMVWLPVFGIVNVRKGVTDACDTAHGDCMDIVRESALEVDCGRKIPCRTGDSNPRQYCTLAFQSDSLPSDVFPPQNAHDMNSESHA